MSARALAREREPERERERERASESERERERERPAVNVPDDAHGVGSRQARNHPNHEEGKRGPPPALIWIPVLYRHSARREDTPHLSIN